MFETVKRIVNCLDYDLTDENISNLPILSEDSSTIATNSVKHYQFEGVVGGWVPYFSPNDSLMFDQMISKRFESIGLSLCSEPIEAMKRLSKNKTTIIDTKENLRKSFLNLFNTEKPKLEEKDNLLSKKVSNSEVESCASNEQGNDNQVSYPGDIDLDKKIEKLVKTLVEDEVIKDLSFEESNGYQERNGCCLCGCLRACCPCFF